MTNSESHYFSLMQAALWGVPVAIERDIDWREVMDIAKFHATTVLVSDVALRLPERLLPPEDYIDKMKGMMRSNLFGQLEAKQKLSMVLTILCEKGIEPVLLKGFGLAQLYPNPVLRQFGDIDLFVGLEPFHEACALVRSLPGAYTWCMEVDSGRHYNVEFGKTVFEIHRVSADITDPREKAVYADIEHEGLVEQTRRVDLEGFPITLPSKEFMVFFTFFHAWRHFITSGVGWRQISDVAMTLHAYLGQVDLDKLRQWLSSMHLMKPWQVFGYLMVNTLGLPEAEMPFYDARCKRKARRLYRLIMKTGNFKRNSSFMRNKPKHRILHKIHAFMGIFVDFFYRVRVFPSAAFREMRTSLKHALSKSRRT